VWKAGIAPCGTEGALGKAKKGLINILAPGRFLEQRTEGLFSKWIINRRKKFKEKR